MPARVHTRILAEPLRVEEAHAFVQDPASGAAVVFTGVVRDHADGRAVAGLVYEAWEERAEAQLAGLARRLLDGWPPLRAVWLEHRVGELAIGETAVVVAVSAPHRDAAFEAARFGIEQLKATVPIWKQEHWVDGGVHWPGTT